MAKEIASHSNTRARCLPMPGLSSPRLGLLVLERESKPQNNNASQKMDGPRPSSRAQISAVPDCKQGSCVAANVNSDGQ